MRKLFLILMTVAACTWSLSAQTRTIHGTVIDAENDEPLIGASIMPVGGGTGVAADLDGNFTLSNLPANVKKATVSYVGYTSQTVDLSNDMVVRLKSSATSLDNVIVVAYGTANKESLTGSVSVVGTQEIEDRPVTAVTAALEGNAPGVQVNTSGSPGSEPSIVIRGFNTINGSIAPLYVVDGVEFTGNINDLNPADIESMSVLKDAASAALYGAKGANGVILITTKRAKKAGKVDVTLQISQGLYSQAIPLYDRLEANDWMQATFDGAVNGYMYTNNASRQEAIDFYREQYIGGYAPLNIYGVQKEDGTWIGQANDQLFDENGKFFNGSILPGYQNDRNWWDVMTQNGHRQEYNLNAAGATDKFNVFASIGYLKEHGYLIRTDFERYNARVNANFTPTSYLRFGLNLAGTQQESDSNNASGGSIESAYGVLTNAPIIPYYAHDAEGNVVYRDGEPRWNTAGYLAGANPAYAMRLNSGWSSATVIDANAYGTAIIPYGFELTVRGTIHRDKTNMNSYYSNQFGSAEGIGYFSEAYYDVRSHQFFQQLNWSHDYGLHHVDVLLDHENYNYYQKASNAMKTGQMFANMMFMDNFENMASIGGSGAQERTEAYLGRARYNYDQKYFGEFSLRRDGCSRFAKENRWGTFWSVGATWIISREKFMERLTWVDYLKLRAAYGSVGNNAAATAYAYWPLYAFGNPYGNVYGTLIPAQIPDPKIHWEATKTFDIGLEGTLFNNRLNFSVGYFDKRNADLLFDVTLAASNGSAGLSGSTQSVTQNIGTMSNRGWELSFNGDIIRNGNVTWTASIDATFIRNKIIVLPNGTDIVSGNQILQEGRSMFQWYLPKYAGVDQLTGDALYELNPSSHEFYTENGQDMAAFNERVQSAQAAGELRVINGRYYTTNDSFASKEYCGTALPVVYGSFGSNFSWRGLHIGFLFTYSLGGKTYDSNYASYMNCSTQYSALHKDILKSWSAAPEGMTADSPDRIDPNGIPQINIDRSRENNGSSSRWLTSSSYLVLKNINVSYDLPYKWVNPLQLQNINIGCSIDNLFTVTSRKGLNPQQSWSGSQGFGLNTARVITFAVTARF